MGSTLIVTPIRKLKGEGIFESLTQLYVCQCICVSGCISEPLNLLKLNLVLCCIFDSIEKCEYVMISVRPASGLSVCGKNLKIAIFLDTMNMINVNLCIMVGLTDFYPFIPLSKTLIVFQGYSSVKQF